MNGSSETVDVTTTAVKAFRILRILRIIKLFRFIKMIRLLNTLLVQLLTRELVTFMRLCRLICVMIMFAHFFACGWYAVGNYTYNHRFVCLFVACNLNTYLPLDSLYS